MEKTEKRTVLLIEDDSLLVKMYKTKFETEGFVVLTANDGEEGLKLALNQKVDLLVLDLMLPKLSGMDLLRKFKEGGYKTPIVVLTNLSQESEAKEALALGAREYLIKADLTPGEVVEKVKAYL